MMLKLQEVTVIYPDKTKAIDGLSFSLEEGESAALIGGNGAGKTSLLLAVVGILDPAGGTIEVNGIRLSRRTVREVRQQAGLVFQNPDDQLFMPLIYDDVAFGCRNYGWPEEKTRQRVEEVLRQLDISHLQDRSPLKLSGGEKRMAAIAAVLAMEPAVLLFDEPTAFLDPKARRKLVETLKQLRQTKIIATHDLDFAAEVCDRMMVLQDGSLVAQGEITALRDEAAMKKWGLRDSLL